jgi:hypothetical protein
VRILAIVQGDYGNRHVANIRQHGPAGWNVATWSAPKGLPAVIDEPDDFLPATLAEADLLLAFQEDARAAQLIADVARRCRARAVIAGVDREEWLPQGLVQQLAGWLAKSGIAGVFPKPLCALSGEEAPGSPEIAEFTRHFGRPAFAISCDPVTRIVTEVRVVRDAVCGCARSVAVRLLGVSADDAEGVAGLAHHHHPCMASMGIDPRFNDTLMHVSGNIMREAVRAQVRPFLSNAEITPDGKVGV